jgi:sodium-dependent phosphate cotransporter
VKIGKLKTPRLPIQLALLLVLLYVFLLSIALLSKSFGLFGKDTALALLATVESPAVGLLIGILATSLIQSSSTTTSVVVGLVGSGVIPVLSAIPVIMGANVGTSITNTLVSMGHIARKAEFRRAFAAATVHDMFNLCAVALLFPLQVATNFIGRIAVWLETLFEGVGGLTFASPLKLATKPVVDFIIDVSGQSGLLVLLAGLVLMFTALHFTVKTMRSLVLSKVEEFFSRYIFRNLIWSLLLGAILTVMVQSSSVTTSLVVPLVGAGVLNLRQIFPYTLGANIGTTVTAMLAALATGSVAAVTVAFSHLVFNICGTAIFLPLRGVPIFMAEKLTEFALRGRWIPLLYIGVVFFLLPLLLVFLMR